MKAIPMNYPYFYDNEVKARPTATINTITTTLKLVGIGHDRSGDCPSVQYPRLSILLSIKHDVGIDFQAVVFCNFSKIITEDALEDGIEGDIMREKTDRKI